VNVDQYIYKGDKVRAQWFAADLSASLAGAQTKVSATLMHAEGVVTHIRGDHPTDPTSVAVWILCADGKEVVVPSTAVVKLGD
jgi:hypothetical protein